MRRVALLLVLSCASILPISAASADLISNVETYASGTAAEIGRPSLDPNAVITAVLSQPGTYNGRTYTTWSFLVNDGTGSLAGFGALPAGSSYTPTVGDAIDLAGSYSPFHQIPEIGTMTAITQLSSGHSVAPPSVSSIPTLNVNPLPFSIATYLFELDNVTISGISGTFGTSNLTGTITDGSSNSMTMFYWPTSYSSCNVNLFGRAVPSGPVNMIGFVSVFTPTQGSPVIEFTPINMTPAPGSAVLGLIGAGILGTRRRRP